MNIMLHTIMPDYAVFISRIWATFKICGMFILIMGLCWYSKLRNSNLQKFLKRNWIIGKLPQASSTAEPPLRLLHLSSCKYSKCQLLEMHFELLEIHFELKEIHFEVIEIQFELIEIQFEVIKKKTIWSYRNTIW